MMFGEKLKCTFSTTAASVEAQSTSRVMHATFAAYVCPSTSKGNALHLMCMCACALAHPMCPTITIIMATIATLFLSNKEVGKDDDHRLLAMYEGNGCFKCVTKYLTYSHTCRNGQLVSYYFILPLSSLGW